MSKSPNIDADLVSATVGSSETTIAHALGRTPAEIFVLKRNVATPIFRGSTTWTSSNVYLQADSSVVATLLIF